MERLRKRKWKPVIIVGESDDCFNKHFDKWFTGWNGLIEDDPCVVEVDEEHQAKYLHLSPCGMSRGRSAATFEFKDKDDYTYTMSMSGTYALLAALSCGLVERSEEVYNGWRVPCVQTKQGANYFIEVFYLD